MAKKKRPPLHMKIRVVLTRPMSKKEAERLVHRAARTGTVPDGIELAYMEWSRGKGRKYRSGEYIGAEAEAALLEFLAALDQAKKRVEVVGE